MKMAPLSTHLEVQLQDQVRPRETIVWRTRQMPIYGHLALRRRRNSMLVLLPKDHSRLHCI